MRNKLTKCMVLEENPCPLTPSDDEADDEASTSSSNIVYIPPTAIDVAEAGQSTAPTTSATPAGPSSTPVETLVVNRSPDSDVDDIFMGPIALLAAMMRKHDLLLIDTRRTFDFVETRILIENHLGEGHILNVPEDLIFPGLSADIFGELLEPNDQKVWAMRETFEMIVLLDADTEKYNFAGSKLEQLRNFIMKWAVSVRHPYSQKPRVLSGGMREFIEWYPTEVGNPYKFLSKTNSEVDELLSLEHISYPEAGAGPQMNLKLHSINSIGNLETRIQRDFAATDPEEETAPRQSLSEGNLPVDYFSSRDNLAGPFKSLSHESLAVKAGPTEFGPIPSPRQALVFEVHNRQGGIRVVVKDTRGDVLPAAADEEDSSSSRTKPAGTVRKSRSRHRTSRADVVEKPPKPSYSTIFGDGFCGLTNINQICYMNSILQCLKVVPILKSIYVVSDFYEAITTLKPPVINPQLAQVLREIWGGTFAEPKYYFIEEFKLRLCEINPDFNKGNHEDAFEFLILLLNLISEDCYIDLARPAIMTESEKAWFGHLQGRSSFLIDTFYYQLKNTTVCYNCRRTNLSFETDSTLMLSMTDENCCLQSMIGEYMKDNLVPDYSCSHCKCTATIVNRKEIVVDPEVLVIVLKRHVISSDGISHKNENPIDFPLKDLNFGKSIYDCCSVVQHTGDTGQGHYFATVLMDGKTNDWLLFDDEQVTQQWFDVNKLVEVKIAAAGFFYIRRS